MNKQKVLDHLEKLKDKLQSLTLVLDISRDSQYLGMTEEEYIEALNELFTEVVFEEGKANIEIKQVIELNYDRDSNV